MPNKTLKPKPSINTSAIKKLRFQTPYFILDKTSLKGSIDLYKKAFGNVEIYYAMKANSEKEVLEFIKQQGLGFEVASSFELRLLKKIAVPPQKIIYGTSVKPAKHIREFIKYGVNRFAFDSEQELLKLSKHAPGSKVYLRVLVKDSADSIFTMSEKFGIRSQNAVELLVKSKQLGLVPYGISFNVGSQARNPLAWANGIKDLIPILKLLDEKGIALSRINLGGGYPIKYSTDDQISTIQSIGQLTQKELMKLPNGTKVIIEPGRGIVAASMMLVVSVIAKIKRPNGYWLYLDGGAYNALLETMAYQGSTRYKITTLKEYADDSNDEFILTGPTGDSLDVIARAEMLPSSIEIGDKLIIEDVGAYSTVLSTPFNGFPKPKIHIL